MVCLSQKFSLHLIFKLLERATYKENENFSDAGVERFYFSQNKSYDESE